MTNIERLLKEAEKKQLDILTRQLSEATTTEEIAKITKKLLDMQKINNQKEKNKIQETEIKQQQIKKDYTSLFVEGTKNE